MLKTILLLMMVSGAPEYDYPKYTSSVVLTGEHNIKDISLEGSLSNSSSEQHIRPIPFKASIKPGEPPILNTLIPDVCSEEIVSESRTDVNGNTVVDFTFTHKHNGAEHILLLGERRVSIKTDMGLYIDTIEPRMRRAAIITGKEEYHDVNLYNGCSYDDQKFSIKISPLESYLVEFNYVGRGRFKFYADPKLDTSLTWKSLSDLEKTALLIPSTQRFQRFRTVIHAGGNHLDFRFMNDSEDDNYKILIYGISVKPYQYKTKEVLP